jgi:hypothetical protein
MRTVDQINNIRKNISDPYSVSGFISLDDINHLIAIFENDTTKIKKNTGPVTVNLAPYFGDSVVENIITRIKKEIGNIEITAAFFFQTEFPHIIHNDDTFELPDNVYKAITLPLSMEGFSGEYPKLCFFDQFYFHGPSKFFNGDDSIPTYYNKQVYDYHDVSELVDTPFADNNNYFTHLKSQWLEGLSLHSALDWIPGNALVFDSVRLHCASDFRTLGIRSKLGISIFTKRSTYE